MSANDARWAFRLARAWRESTLPATFGEVTHCIEAAKLGRLALKRVFVDAEPLPCGYVICNAEAEALMGRGVPVSEWPGSAWSVGVDPDATDVPGVGWNGHLLLRGDGWIADLSAGQFSRPLRNLTVHAWAAPIDPTKDVLTEPTRYAAPDGNVVALVVPRPELRAWKNGSAWRGTPPRGWVEQLTELTLSLDEETKT